MAELNVTEELEVRKILEKRTINGTDEFKVWWKDYSRSQSTWEPFDNLVNCLEKIEDYERGRIAEILGMY